VCLLPHCVQLSVLPPLPMQIADVRRYSKHRGCYSRAGGGRVVRGAGRRVICGRDVRCLRYVPRRGPCTNGLTQPSTWRACVDAGECQNPVQPLSIVTTPTTKLGSLSLSQHNSKFHHLPHSSPVSAKLHRSELKPHWCVSLSLAQGVALLYALLHGALTACTKGLIGRRGPCAWHGHEPSSPLTPLPPKRKQRKQRKQSKESDAKWQGRRLLAPNSRRCVPNTWWINKNRTVTPRPWRPLCLSVSPGR
jgi:hypothetical protein